MANDEQMTETTETTATQAEEKPAKAEPIFAAQKETLVVLEPANPAGMYRQITVTVERGVETFEKDGKTENRDRFRASWEGKSGKLAASGKGAITSLLSAANYGKVDDFTFDVSSDFFAATPRDNKPKGIWDGENAARLAELREAANKAFADAENEEISAQDAWRQASIIMNEVNELLGGAKNFAAFVKGGNGMAEMPFLAKLGDGVNALSEARRLGQLTDFQYQFLPASIMRGKAVVKFVNEGVNSLLKDALESVKTFTGNPEKVSPEMMADAIVQLYARCGVKETVPANDVGAFVAAVKSQGEEFAKRWNKVTHADGDRGTAQVMVAASELVGMIEDYFAAEAAVDAGEKDALAKRNKVALIGRFAAQWEALGNAKAAEKQAEAVLKAADSDDNQKLDAKTKLKDRAATDIAAQVFNTIKTDDANKMRAIRDALSILINDHLKALAELEKAKSDEADAE